MIDTYYAKAAEQAVLGGLLLDNDKLIEVTDLLVTEDFYDPMHRELFTLFLKLTRELKPLDCLVVGDYLSTTKSKIPEVYVYELVKNTPSAANILTYANIVLESSRKRQLLKMTQKTLENIEQLSVKAVVEKLESELFYFNKRQVGQQYTFAPSERLPAIFESLNPENKSKRLMSGFKDLDKMTSGFAPADFIVIAARPSMGKTSLGMNIVENLARAQKYSLVFSLETNVDDLLERMLASYARINLQEVRNNYDKCITDLQKAGDFLNQDYCIINDNARLAVTEILPEAKRWMRTHNKVLDLIVIDYLQFLTLPADRTVNSRYDQISNISRIIKATAKELKVPIIALAQLNRETDKEKRRPRMSDIRDSGGVEQDADLILMLYRDEVYYPDSADKGIAELNIVKQRNGPIGNIKLSFINKYVRFENYARG